MENIGTIFTVVGAIASVVSTIVAILAFRKAQQAINIIGESKDIKNANIKSGNNSKNIIGHNNRG